MLLRLAQAMRSHLARTLARLPGSSLQFGPPRSMGAADEGVREIFPERPVMRPAAALADPPMDRVMSRPSPALIKRVFVAGLPHGRYWGRHFGYIIDRHDRLLADLSPTFTAEGKRHDGLNQPFLPSVHEVEGTVAIISTLYSDNFHHWLIETLPRFHWLERAGWSLDRIDRFVVPAQRASYHRESYARLGIDESRLISHSAELHLRATLLLAPCASEPAHQPHLYDYTPEGLAYVRDLFLRDNPHLRNNSPRRILVSREKASARRLVQAVEAERRLSALGFVKVLLEDLSVAEQAALFHGAECVIMPTGGNLANLAFCQPGTAVIELFGPNYLPVFHHALMGPLRLRHHALIATRVVRPNPQARGVNEDIDIDPARLEAVTRQALGLG